jgi:hypothetical protein
METTTTPPKSNLVKILLVVFGIALVVFAIVVGAVIATSNRNQPSTNQNTANNPPPAPLPQPTPPPVTSINWTFNDAWVSMVTVPDCPNPFTVNSPSDLTNATHILYPGQTRGGDFKPHGGIRYDNATAASDVSVSLPLDAILWRGAQYIESGEVQYLMDFIVPCGYMMRFDHLYTLTPEFAEFFAQLPAPEVDQSRTNTFNPPTSFAAGTKIATAAGHTLPQLNVAFDFGLYDLRQYNESYQDPVWAALHADEKETAYYGVCWLELLPANQKAIALSLPGGGTEGKTSDYCD